jgi:hypothetical protein
MYEMQKFTFGFDKKRDEASKIFEKFVTKVFIASLIKGTEVISRF